MFYISFCFGSPFPVILKSIKSMFWVTKDNKGKLLLIVDTLLSTSPTEDGRTRSKRVLSKANQNGTQREPKPRRKLLRPAARVCVFPTTFLLWVTNIYEEINLLEIESKQGYVQSHVYCTLYF